MNDDSHKESVQKLVDSIDKVMHKMAKRDHEPMYFLAPPWLVELMDEEARKPEVCSPAGLHSLFPGLRG